MNSLHTVINYTQFEEHYQKIKQNNKFVLYFTGTTDETTGRNWCSDCEAAYPFIKSHVIPKCQELAIPLLEVKNGLRDEWKNPNHPLRHHKDFKLQGIPGNFEKSLLEQQITNKQLLLDFFEDL
ncbi:thioredoxin-related protein 14, putative [Ichthyophthirius multifiliis]|uniref:Thioredoxin-related protein 14, putative n=1 Tax=Ichthyophthirius multifiliis TaxID=5932 RepID=G0QNA9_ICHMU|nr:thioredoxin-related protein 14, putative [Ichthyophthirius multifiliis]EGR33301.1 thioredoxin-related protein 14, putative [Ichthyophthirius multifiliis]|eukprot:XP_004037287.1 thioredoxin-related protein 14, putative [Ichthyophthirius multifiliis]